MNLQIVTISIAIALSFGISTESHADDRTEIEALYKKLEHAQKVRSPEETLALLAPGFTYTDRKGNALDRVKFVDQMRDQLSEVKAIKEMKVKVTKVVITGKSAKVTNSFSWAMEIEDAKGQMGPAGNLHVMASKGSVENNLYKTDKGWRFLTLQTVSGKMTMDGKPMVHQGEAQSPPPDKQ